MSLPVQMASVAQAKRTAENGVDFSPRHGARCPWCGRRTRIYATRPWDGPVRVRYHYCQTPSCPMASMRVTIKSVQVDR